MNEKLNEQKNDKEGRKKKLKLDPVMCAAYILAAVSAFFVRPDKGYLNYIDWRSLGILWGLMVIIRGFRENGIFEKIASVLLKKVDNGFKLSLVLIFLCFFGSMFITNDVALITFVPFAIMILHSCKREDLTIYVVILQTIAANLGSMMTPIGNPQNLYLFGIMHIGIGQFMLILLPYTIVTAVLLLICCLLLPGRRDKLEQHESIAVTKHFGTKTQIIIYTILFIVAVLSVLEVVPWYVMVILVLLIVGGMDFKILLGADYILLLTFIGFFIFTGNIGRVDKISELLSHIVAGREFAAGIISSQLISNVPSALLINGFANDLSELLKGVNIGGLGTLIASMASLISYKGYTNACPDKKGRYLLMFTAFNVGFLIVMILIHFVF